MIYRRYVSRKPLEQLEIFDIFDMGLQCLERHAIVLRERLELM